MDINHIKYPVFAKHIFVALAHNEIFAIGRYNQQIGHIKPLKRNSRQRIFVSRVVHIQISRRHKTPNLLTDVRIKRKSLIRTNNMSGPGTEPVPS